LKEIKAAIIGAGSAARLHLLAYRKCSQTEVTAICGTNLDRANALGKEFGVRAYISIDEMLRQERPDVVSVTTLEWNHEVPVLKSLDAGCHVLCEKVMAHTLEIGESMVAAAQRMGRTLGVNYNYRSVPSHELIKQEIALGGFGEPALFTANMHSYLWAHMVDLLRYFFGDPIAVTAAMVDDQSRRPRITDNTSQAWMHSDIMLYQPSVAVSASFRFRDPDFIATLSGSALVPIDQNFWSFALFGTSAALTVNAAGRANLGGVPSLGPVADRLKSLAPCSYEQSFDRSVMAFVEAIQEGRPAPVTGHDGLAAMRLEAAIVESVRTGHSITQLSL
jgi:predicted dehydrogenase